jgi:anaerobic magnesium-protoporphyrin IX monomethyl ester cyclase
MKFTLVCHKYGVPLADPCCFPLGFMYVSSILKKAGHEVKVLNYNLYYYDLEEEIKGSDYVLFTGFEEFLQPIIRDSAICRKQGIKTVVGGALATFCPNLMTPHVDIVLQGEMDSDTPIDEIPYPDYEGFGINEYAKHHDIQYISILTSRGCPFSCTFCRQICNYRERNLDKVREEIEFYKNKYNIECIVFNDNTLNVSKERFMKVCEIAQDTKLMWSAAIRVDNFDEEMAIAAKKSNCIELVVGIESFIQEKLDYMNKKIKVEDIYKTLDLIEKHNIYYQGNVLVGFENETFDDIFRETTSMPPYNVFPCLVQPFIGTKHGRKRNLSDVEEKCLEGVFTEYLQSKGKYMYPKAVICD